ncbi:MAG: hypothetical protein ACXWFI_08145 [Methylobacter sp.]
MHYRDFFLRGQDRDGFDNHPYKTKIISSHGQDKKTANLFEDCFSNHVNFECSCTNELIFDTTSNSRFIKRDNLSSYFINHVYEIPEITNYIDKTPIKYSELLAEITETSFSNISKERFKLGSNRIRYIVGDVGVGKSSFIKRVISDISLNTKDIDSHYNIIIVYFNLEEKYNYGLVPVPLKDDFLTHLFNKILESIANECINIDLTEIYNINPNNNQVLALKFLIAKLKENKIRLLLFIDNLDFYHYYYARYSFFKEYNAMQEDSVHENIRWLQSVLTTGEGIGNLGLNVVISSRNYVYDEIMAQLSDIDTEINTSSAIKISLPDEETVIKTRLDLLSQAIQVVIKNRPATERTLKELLVYLRTKLLSDKYTQKNHKNSPVNIIYKLGQHGHRSLVQFFSSLKISYLDHELMDRFLERQVSSLYILYFNNMYNKYTQQQEHFPNIFLVDCTVMDGKGFEIAHQPHVHTYWLKYFVLKYIYVKRAVKLDELLEVFCEIGKYQEHLVRHVIGSLCTANEFRCAEIDSKEVSRSFISRQIKVTERGKALLAQNNDIELCFDFEYLSTIIDDMWLSYPKYFIDHIFKPSSDFSHLYKTDKEYAAESSRSVLEKAECLIWFIHMLDVAYNEEIKKRKPLLDKIIKDYSMKPDFYKIRTNVISSAEKIVNILSPNHTNSSELNKISKMSKTIAHEKHFELFFEEYFDSGVLVSP